MKDPEDITHVGEHESESARRQPLLFAGVGVAVLLLFLGMWGWRAGWFELFTDLTSLREWILGLGGWAPAGIVALNFLQALFSPIPGHVLNMLSGYLFGPWVGTLLTLAGLLMGNAVGLLLARWLGRPFLRWALGEARLRQLDGYSQRWGSLTLFLLFLIPFVPDDSICLMAGLIPLPLPWILLLALVGRAPGLFIANALGYYGQTFTVWQWGVLGLCAVVGGVLLWRYGARIERAVLAWASGLSARRFDGHSGEDPDA